MVVIDVLIHFVWLSVSAAEVRVIVLTGVTVMVTVCEAPVQPVGVDVGVTV